MSARAPPAPTARSHALRRLPTRAARDATYRRHAHAVRVRMRACRSDANGCLEPRAVHAALPVVRGEKWACNHWISLTPLELLLQVGS